MKYLAGLILALSLSACAPDSTEHSGHDMQVQDKGIVVSEAVLMPPFPGKDTAAAYFTLTNHGADDRIISVSSPISDAVEIHNHIEEEGVMKMRRVDGVEIGAGETVTFKPGSFHIMLFKANLPESQDDVALTLTYENAPAVTIIAPIDGRGSQDDHSGH